MVRTGAVTRRLVMVAAIMALTAAAAGRHRPHVQGQAGAAVTIQNFTFFPATLTVAPGATVTWTHRDAVGHTVTSGVPNGPGAGSMFDTPPLSMGQTFSFTFTQTGTFPYFCRIHNAMRGTIDVKAATTATQPPQPAAPPAAQPESPPVGQPSGQPSGPPAPANARAVVNGLLNPRGFTWGPDGALYVTESGNPPAGYSPPAGPAQPDAAPVVNMNGRISRVAADGTRTTMADNLPVFVGPIGDTLGAAALAFVGDDLYAAISAGPKHGHPEFPGGIYRIGRDGSTTLVANTDEYNIANPPVGVNHNDLTDELSNPYDMVALNGKLYITDGNKDVIHVVDPVAPEGSRISRLIDLSQEHLVLTGIAAGPDGNLYVTNLSPAPFKPGVAKVWRITLDGQVAEVASGLSAAVGVAVAPDGTIYVSEFAKALGEPPFFDPPGRVVRIAGDRSSQLVAAPLYFPTIIRWGADGLYATNFSVGGDAGTGAIFQIDVSPVP